MSVHAFLFELNRRVARINLAVSSFAIYSHHIVCGVMYSFVRAADATRGISEKEIQRLRAQASEVSTTSYDAELLLHSTEINEEFAQTLLGEVRLAAERSLAGAPGVARVDARLVTTQNKTALVATICKSAVEKARLARGLDSVGTEEVENELAKHLLANYNMALLTIYNASGSPLVVPPAPDVAITFQSTGRRVRARPTGR